METMEGLRKVNVVILGGNGYLGAKLGRRLAELGMIVYSVTRKAIIQEWAKDNWQYEELENKLKKYEVDWMINCIAKYERDGTSIREILEANYLQPYCCFMQGVESGVRKYITIDTGLPIECNMYSRAKKQFADSFEWKLNEAFNQKDYVFWNIQLEFFYGCDEPENRFLTATIKKLKKHENIMLTEGYQKRDFIYVDDVINNLTKMFYIDEHGRVDLPLGTGEGISIREAVSYLKEIVGSQSELLFGAVASRKVEPDCIADTLLMKQYGLNIDYNWKEGFKLLACQ